MNWMRKSLILASILAVSACTSGSLTSNEVRTLNNTQDVGTPFTKYLATEYRHYANSEESVMFDYPDALHFARKGLAASYGELVMPETLDDWNLNNAHIIEMSNARAMLIDVMENGSREIAPHVSAVAQARFDCWVEQQEENWQRQEISECKNQFFASLRELQNLVKPEPAPVLVEEAPVMAEPAPLPAPVTDFVPVAEYVPLEQAAFIVFFDWDKHSLTSGATDVLDAITHEVKGRDDVTTVVITSHTDSSGATKYNQKLSDKRGKTIKDGLVIRGIAPDKVRIEAKGESDLLVKTKDNTREPANRRAQISLE